MTARDPVIISMFQVKRRRKTREQKILEHLLMLSSENLVENQIDLVPVLLQSYGVGIQTLSTSPTLGI